MNITYIYHFVLLLWLLENGNLKKKRTGRYFYGLYGTITVNILTLPTGMPQFYNVVLSGKTKKVGFFSAVFKSNSDDWLLENFPALWNWVVLISSNFTMQWQGNDSEMWNETSAKKKKKSDFSMFSSLHS